MPEGVTVVVIRSLSFTGTTWINTLLGCHPRAFALGPPDRVIDLYDQGWHEACRVHGRSCAFWPEFHQRYDPEGNFYLQLAEFAGKDFIVVNNPFSGTKADADLHHDDIAMKEMRVVRDGRAICRSYIRYYPENSYLQAVRDWFRGPAEAFDFYPDDPGVLCMRYEDVVDDQFTWIGKFGEFLRLEYPENTYKFWEFEHHMAAGNSGMWAFLAQHQAGRRAVFKRKGFYESEYARLLREPEKPIKDESWKAELTRWDRLVFERYCGPINERWGYPRDTFDPEELRKVEKSAEQTGPPTERSAPADGSVPAGDGRANAEAPRRLLQAIKRRLIGHREDASPCEPEPPPEQVPAIPRRDYWIDKIRTISDGLRASNDASHILYASWYDAPEKIDDTALFYRACLVDMIDGYSESTGCDVGCWFGVSCLVQKALGARRVYGVDILPGVIREAAEWAAKLNIPDVHFREMFEGIIPLQSNTMDWAIFNQVLCNDVGGNFYRSLAEAHRVCRPGGVVAVCDNNNPYCPATIERLKKTTRRLELGGGDEDSPDGRNYHGRREMIRRIAPDLPDETVNRLARETCYMWGRDLARAVWKYVDTGEWPRSAYDPELLKPSVMPSTGWANGNVTDPYALCRAMERLGLEAHICVMPSWDKLDNEALYDQLRANEGFYVYGRKKEDAPAAERRNRDAEAT